MNLRIVVAKRLILSKVSRKPSCKITMRALYDSGCFCSVCVIRVTVFGFGFVRGLCRSRAEQFACGMQTRN